MAVNITSVSPVRGRSGDDITITGTGFSATNNSVNIVSPDGIDSVLQTLSTQSTTEITFTASGTLVVNLQNRILVTNNDDISVAHIHWFVKDTIANLIAGQSLAQQPGAFENVEVEIPQVAEAKDYERLAAYAERINEVGSDTFPNSTSGAESVKTSTAGWSSGTPARSSVQAVLEMLDSIAVGAFPPTPSTWGSNSETLSGDKVLSDTSDTIQFLDPNGADREVILPLMTAVTPFFLIANTQELGVEDRLVLKSDIGQLLVYILAGEAARVWTDGTAGYVYSIFPLVRISTTKGALVFPFGANFNAVSHHAIANGTAGEVSSLSINHTTEHIISEAGMVDIITYHVEVASGLVLKIFKNGAEAAGSPVFSTTEGRWFPSLPVSAGDQIAIEFHAGTNPGNSTLQLFVNPSAGLFSNFTWGGEGDSSSEFFKTCGAPSAPTESSSQATEYTILESCVASTLAWNTELATSGTEYAIHLNGALSEVVELTGATGVFSLLPTAFWVGDTVQIEFSTGNVPGDGTVTLSVSGATGMHYFFGGVGAEADYYRVQGIASDSALPSVDTFTAAVTQSGTATKLSRRCANPTSDTYGLWNNNALSELQTTPGSTTSEVMTFDTIYLSLDTVSISDESANNPGANTLALLFKT